MSSQACTNQDVRAFRACSGICSCAVHGICHAASPDLQVRLWATLRHLGYRDKRRPQRRPRKTLCGLRAAFDVHQEVNSRMHVASHTGLHCLRASSTERQLRRKCCHCMVATPPGSLEATRRFISLEPPNDLSQGLRLQTRPARCRHPRRWQRRSTKPRP